MLKNFKISTKILFAVIFISLIGIGLSVFATVQMKAMGSSFANVIESRDAATMRVLRASRYVNETAYSAYKTVTYDGGSSEAGVAATARGKAAANAAKMLTEAQALLPEDADGFGQLISKLSGITAKSQAATDLGLQNADDAARSVLAEMDKIVAEYMAVSVALGDRLIAGSASEAVRLDQSVTSTIITTLVGAFAGLVLGIIGALLISAKGITAPLSRLGQRMAELASGRLDVEIEGQARGDEIGSMARSVQVFKDAAKQNKQLEAEAGAAREAQESQRDRQTAIDTSKAEDLRVFVHAVEHGFNALSDGDLTVRMDQAVAPEFEPIREKFNDSVGKLEDTIGSVVTAIGAIRVGLNEISVASNDLAQRTEQQAASLEETVAALSEVTAAVNETANGASQAQAVATTAQKNAEKGGEIVGRAVTAMAAIEQSSDKIGKIIGVIDEIAFQTNLLALNAGVEAARAGEAGRGFAVVAQEVRGLAQRSAEAAKEIKELISTSSTQVEQGVALVTTSGRSLKEIVTQVAEMNGVVSEIARSAREQATSLREVSTAADQMDKVTQQNAAMVEETTAAAQNLTTETEELAAIVAQFRTNLSGGQNRAPVRRASPSKVVQLRTTSSAKPKPSADADDWQNF